MLLILLRRLVFVFSLQHTLGRQVVGVAVVFRAPGRTEGNRGRASCVVRRRLHTDASSTNPRNARYTTRPFELLAQALELREQHASAQSAETADSLNRLGNIYRRFGRLVEAEPMHELERPDDAERLLCEALALHEAAGTLDGLRGADVRLALGRFLIDQSRLDEARDVLLLALASASRELPENSPELDRYEQALAESKASATALE